MFIKKCAIFLCVSMALTFFQCGDAALAATASKMDSYLSFQLKNKLERASQKTPFSISSEGTAEEQSLYIYFSKEPTSRQLEDLSSMGIKVYPDSWLSPPGSGEGFLLASSPVDKLPLLAGKDYVVRLTSAEKKLKPYNDLAAQKIGADIVRESLNYDGSGVKVAVLDSGLDLGHKDIAAPIQKKDYSNYPKLDSGIEDMVSGHGTHVTGSAVGRGTLSGGRYKGMAPGADLIFLKIGDDDTGDATSAAMVHAIKDARDVYGADIINISYGGWSDYHDGSDEICRAVDWATDQGAAVFTAAGNDGDAERHYSGTVPARGSSGYIRVDVDNKDGYDFLMFNLVWYDGLGVSKDLELEYYDSKKKKLSWVVAGEQSESPRGTESEYSGYPYLLPYGKSTYYLKVVNNSSKDQFFHIYEGTYGNVTFADPDPGYTVASPAEADGAIAVGAYVTRPDWVNYRGKSYQAEQAALDQVAGWSSRGPRVDGTRKPDLAAPGVAIISCRDENAIDLNGVYDSLIIDNDGDDLDGSGPADYIAMYGTSMASPVAAGAAALVLQAVPEARGDSGLLRSILVDTAVDAGESGPDNMYGYGLINVAAAVDRYISNGSLKVMSTTPDNKATGVKPDGAVTVEFNREVASGDNFNAITLVNNGDNSPVSITGSIEGNILSISHPALAGGVTYRLDIPAGAVKSADGEIMERAYSITFTTLAVKQKVPRVSSVKFSKETLIIKGSNFEKTDGYSRVVFINTDTGEELNAGDCGSVTVKSGKEIRVENLLLAGGEYSVTVINPGEVYSNANKTFTIKDTLTPRISRVTPKTRGSGSESFKMTIYGSNFLSGCLVEYKPSGGPDFIALPEDVTVQRQSDKITVVDFPGLEEKGYYDIRITNNRGSLSGSSNLEKAFKIK
ncbi:secreted peptidase [Desulfocucumis palustris]|uniref:Secreted peptidase n=1 Tax=Desulfocucumis palustris TaxID=1898651 RepID=A0A2L2XGV6_9FIRM|nr:S8 family serine peptidase [Desulfocucumis palustris]GBF35360.1 secreted peptidase [Desulfocucumis palustris]